MSNNKKNEDYQESLNPHCGVYGVDEDDPKFLPRYVRVGKWNKTDLTYKFVNFDIVLPKDDIRNAFALACSIWSGYSKLTFREVHNETADIVIGFYNSQNSCAYCNPAFGNVKNYAHGFFPPTALNGALSIAGDIHFNKAVKWTTAPTSSDYEIDLVTVAAHEIGHVLGLDHVGLSEALMHKFCKRPHRYLHSDDVLGIQNLYGRR